MIKALFEEKNKIVDLANTSFMILLTAGKIEKHSILNKCKTLSSKINFRDMNRIARET